MASAAPPVRFPNVYGIDMPAIEEFVAHDRTVDEIAHEIGADWLIYQDLRWIPTSKIRIDMRYTLFDT
jgi:amidophosphoribosyltransferase